MPLLPIISLLIFARYFHDYFAAAAISLLSAPRLVYFFAQMLLYAAAAFRRSVASVFAA